MLLTGLVLTAGLALWVNQPEPDPWAEVPPGQPHPRIGARVAIAPQVFVHLPPLEVAAREEAGPAHWTSALSGLADADLAARLPPPDQQETGPDGRVHRFWYSWCPTADGERRWVAHLWTASRGGRVASVHLVGGGGVLIGESPAPVRRVPDGVRP